MHLPDQFLSLPMALGLNVAAAGVLAFSLRKARTTLTEQDVPLMGLSGAFVLAAQMINIPVAAGTSGHLLGGVLLATLLGPWAATVVMAAVFTIQCLLLQDGGLLALGANFLNMGVMGTLLGYGLLQFALHVWPRGERIWIFAVSWLCTMLASGLVAVQLSLSQPTLFPMQPTLWAMLGWHALVGLLEGALTVSVVSVLAKTRPGLLRHRGEVLS